MSMTKRLKQYLDKNGVEYELSAHKEAFTAQEIAACMHVPGKVLTKVVMIKAGEKDIMTVLPACRKVDIGRLKNIFKNEKIRLATEEEFKDLFPECDVGSMPPFGNLYGVDVYVDKALADDEYIIVQAGTHTETVRLKYEDFFRLVKPQVCDFSIQSM